MKAEQEPKLSDFLAHMPPSDSGPMPINSANDPNIPNICRQWNARLPLGLCVLSEHERVFELTWCDGGSLCNRTTDTEVIELLLSFAVTILKLRKTS